MVRLWVTLQFYLSYSQEGKCCGDVGGGRKWCLFCCGWLNPVTGEGRHIPHKGPVINYR